jgi:SAM-dependent methyltransferase
MRLDHPGRVVGTGQRTSTECPARRGGTPSLIGGESAPIIAVFPKLSPSRERAAAPDLSPSHGRGGTQPGNARFGKYRLFRDVDLAGRSVLDIGAGDGEVSFYAACAGASRVVSLEPEAAGSRSRAREGFPGLRERIGADQVELLGQTLQECDPNGERFDVLVSIASVNHIDEEACVRLHHDPEARARYEPVLKKLADLANPGADLILCDVSRPNFFARIGRRNPITATIEWEKHRAPELWAGMLEAAGFRDPRISWGPFNTVRDPGRILLGNRVASYFLTSAFRLATTRAG